LVGADLQVGPKSKKAITLSDDGPSMTHWSSSLHHPNAPSMASRWSLPLAAHTPAHGMLCGV